MKSWKECLFLSAQNYPDKNAFVDETSAISYRQLNDITDRIKSIFVDKNVDKSPRVLVILPRNVASAAVLTSLLCCEFVGLFLDTKISEAELGQVIAQVKPHAIITGRSLNLKEATLAQDLSELFNSSMRMQLLFLSVPPHPATPQSLRWLLHTSGSSGEAKAVMISDENLWQRAEVEVADFKLRSDDTLLNCLPFSHDLGLNQVLCTLYLGSTLYIKSRSVSPFLEAVQVSKAIGVTATPLVWIDFLKSHSDPVQTSLRYLTISGGTLASPHQEKLRSVFPGVQIFKTYGQTETFRTFINETDSEDLGRVLAGVRIETSLDGELIHFGKTAMLGYLFAPELSKQAINSSGGILTKDLVETDATGKVFFKGRRDDLVKRFEQRFHLSEVEGVFQGLAGVHSAVAVCIDTPAGDWRQHYLGVFVLLKKDVTLSGAELLQLVQHRLSYFKIPDKVFVLDRFPQTASHKVDRVQLRQIFKAEVLA